jgi:peptide/nickel transport system permease protein
LRAFVLKRLLFMIPTLIGISFVTFLLMELAPGDAVLSELHKGSSAVQFDAKVRAQHVKELMKKHGLVDAEGHKLSVAVRYWRWLKNASVMQFSGSQVGSEPFREKIFGALPLTLLMNAFALLLAFAVAIPLGAKAGMRPGSGTDRLTSGIAFFVYGVPEFLIATLLLLAFCGGLFSIFPAAGYHAPDTTGFGPVRKLFDLAEHLFLPVLALSIGYSVVLFRFLRESVARASQSEFVLALRGFGASEFVVRKRVLRNGLSPVVTILGTMLPTLVGGTVVVERVFSIPGIGWLTVAAVSARDMPMVMALTMLVSVVTLVSLLVSDILQRVVDPRVVLR